MEESLSECIDDRGDPWEGSPPRRTTRTTKGMSRLLHEGGIHSDFCGVVLRKMDPTPVQSEWGLRDVNITPK